ncbi:uncharacterized protein LOC106961727 isoform X1 [Poecilia latipinna]|uniref:uncharacterized protein LOC106961727 isoform X1 n=1 Tax=Poecilia latipinna TaxID=48699 RepID=UPI00072EEB45|nr:PREDICTED: uncharacterized protein LOC106961727 isoform X1 [Poecilia latipinna]
MATRWGICGAGKISDDFTVALKTRPAEDHQIVAVAAHKLEDAQEFANKHSISRVYGSYEELARDPDIDVVYVGVVHPYHLNACKLFINAKKNVLSEKSLAMNTKEVKEILDSAKKNNVFLMEAAWTRFFQASVQIRNLLSWEYIGEVKMVRADYGVPLLHMSRSDQKDRCEGALLGLGICCLQFICMVYKGEKPESIQASGTCLETGVDETVAVILRYSKNRMAMFTCSAGVELHSDAIIVGTKGTIQVLSPMWCPTSLVVNRKETQQLVPEPSLSLNFTYSTGKRCEVEEVRQCLLKGLKESPVMSHAYTLLLAEMGDEICQQVGGVYSQDYQRNMATRWGICSVGKISHDFTVALKTLPAEDHQVVAVAARKLEDAQEFANKHSISRVYGSYEELARDPDMGQCPSARDIVHVGVIPPYHLNACKLFINAKKNVLCEKSLAMNTKELKEILDSAKKNNVFLMEAVWTRFFQASVEIRNLLAQEYIGEVKMVRADYSLPLLHMSRSDQKDLSEGALLGLGIYCLQFISMVYKGEKPESIQARGVCLETGVDETVAVILRYSKNRMATFTCSAGVELHSEAIIIGTEGKIQVLSPMWCPTSIIVDRKETEYPIPERCLSLNFTYSTGKRYEVEEVRQCLLKGLKESPVTPHAYTLLLAEMGDEIRRQVDVVYSQDCQRNMATRWGICSAGKISHDFTVALKTLPAEDHQVVAVAARKLEDAQEFSRKHNISKAYGSYEELARDPDVDVVYVGVVHPCHLNACKLFINAKKNVLCEKPLAMNAKEVKEILDSAEKNDVFLMEAAWTRFFQASVQIRNLLSWEYIGEVKMVRADYGVPLLHMSRSDQKDRCEGALLGLGICCLQFICMVYKGEKPESIQASGTCLETGVDETVAVILRYSKNRMAMFTCSAGVELHSDAIIVGTKGTIQVLSPMWCPTSLVVNRKETQQLVPEPSLSLNFTYSTGKRCEVEEVRQCLLKGLKESPVMSHAYTLLLAEMGDEICQQVGGVYSQDYQRNMATRWGICSVGKISHDFTVALKTLPAEDHQVVAVAARKLEDAQEFSRKHNISKAYGSYEELARDPDVDVVYVGVVHPCHLNACKLFINAKKNVLCEKPLAMNTKEVKEILDSAKKNNVFLMEVAWTRFFPASVEIRKLLAEEYIGEVKMVRADFGVPLFHVPRSDQKDLGGGALLGLGISCLQFISMVYNREKPESIQASGICLETGVDESVAVILQYSKNRMAMFTCSAGVHLHGEAFIAGTNGIIEVLSPMWCPTALVVNEKVTQYPVPEPHLPLNFTYSTGMRYEAEEVRQCLLKGNETSAFCLL